ncbi:MAG: hypothetical protein QE570_05035 [Verrucomicrobiota bacterium]|nr:hypothetical protein [Verrucomicrobiota bacterium]
MSTPVAPIRQESGQRSPDEAQEHGLPAWLDGGTWSNFPLVKEGG